MRMRSLSSVLASVPASLVLTVALGAAAAAAQQQPATPQPFPQPGTSSRSGQPARNEPAANPPAPASQAQAPPSQAPRPAGPESPTPSQPGAGPAAPTEAPTEATLGLPVYPQAQFIASYNAGQGQRYYLYGTAASFTQVSNFYRSALKQRGEVVFEEPATLMFETGRYREDTMAFPPGVTVKDYTWGNMGGYLNPKRGVQPERFQTVIQIVPSPAGQP
jgi:hypothetical protein